MAGRRGTWIYRTRRWKALRRAKLASADWRCERCGQWGNEVHHRIPLAQDGPPFPDLSGLEVMCRQCHRERHLTPTEVARERELTVLLNWVVENRNEKNEEAGRA